MTQSFKNIKVEIDSKVCIVTINRPERKNAMDVDTFMELSDMVDQIEHNDEILALILTGHGDESFSSGGDLKYLKTLDTLHKGREMSSVCGNVLDRIEGLDIPVIGAINGYAFGGGCELALACDYRIASKEATFGFRQITMGIMTSWGGGKRLVRTVGKSKALMLLLTGDVISAKEALDLGFVDLLVEKNEVLPFAKELGGRIVKNAPLSIRFIKKFINSCVDMSGRDANLLETELFSILWGSEDHNEAVEAFFAKREARYKGQ
ncbi:MAG TPA: enoyl-CoA hydratase/isomerase family protein [Deltaproteobacteria bacterium]|nr:enoyl-CoA hydratase/isomerase family protein [Deltaproteobacteria bacterium]